MDVRLGSVITHLSAAMQNVVDAVFERGIGNVEIHNRPHKRVRARAHKVHIAGEILWDPKAERDEVIQGTKLIASEFSLVTLAPASQGAFLT